MLFLNTLARMNQPDRSWLAWVGLVMRWSDAGGDQGAQVLLGKRFGQIDVSAG
jgi:hypothetical protein